MSVNTGQTKTIISDKETTTTATVESIGNGKGAILAKIEEGDSGGVPSKDILKDILVELKVLNKYMEYMNKFEIPRESFEREV